MTYHTTISRSTETPRTKPKISLAPHDIFNPVPEVVPVETLEDQIVDYLESVKSERLISTVAGKFSVTEPKMRGILRKMAEDGLIVRIDGNRGKSPMYARKAME